MILNSRLKQLYLFGKKLYDYQKPRANFIGRFTKRFVISDALYEAQKQEGIAEFLRGTERKSFEKHQIVIELKKLGMKTLKIAEIVHLDRSQVWRILKDYEKSSGNVPKTDEVEVVNKL